MQKVFFCYGSIEKIREILENRKSKNIFLVTGKRSFYLSGAQEKILDIIKGKKYTHFNSFSSNPTIDEIKKGTDLFKKNQFDIVISVGGGSAIDIAKAINVLSFQKENAEVYLKGKKELEEEGLPLIAVPLTAGTGSESTRFSTIYIDKKKYSLSSERHILPNYAVIDPSLHESMSKRLTAITGLDALTQSIESLWSVNSNNESIQYAKKSIKLSLNAIVKAVINPDRRLRVDMAKAANLSGKAINISKTTACHSISYPITSYFNIPHGHAVALTLPEIIEYNYNISSNDCIDKRGVKFVKERMSELLKLLDCRDGKEANIKIKNLMKQIGIETKLRDLNIDVKDIEIILNEGFTADRMNNNPRKINRNDLENILSELL